MTKNNNDWPANVDRSNIIILLNNTQSDKAEFLLAGQRFKCLVLAKNDARDINNNEQGNILNSSLYQCELSIKLLLHSCRDFAMRG